MNNESKRRRLYKSLVLGKGEGRVISYADLEEARAERMKKDAAKENRRRGKRSRKLEVNSTEADAERPARKKMRFAAVQE